MTNINQIIATCAATTKAKGFDTSQHATQIALIATEVVEALECVGDTNDTGTRDFIRDLTTICENYELYRKAIRKPDRPYTDNSTLREPEHLNEELADIVIRVFSYVGGNDQGEAFVQALQTKMGVNMNRPQLHGKAF